MLENSRILRLEMLKKIMTNFRDAKITINASHTTVRVT